MKEMVFFFAFCFGVNEEATCFLSDEAFEVTEIGGYAVACPRATSRS